MAYDSENSNEEPEDIEVKPSQLEWDEDDPNLVDKFLEHRAGKRCLEKLADTVINDFNSAKDASEEYRQKVADDWRIFSGKLKPKPFPFEGCANAHVPIYAEVLTRLHARAKSELFPDRDDVFTVKKLSASDATAEVLTKHGNWQIRNEITDFFRQVGDRGLLQFLGPGDVTVHSTYDARRGRNCHDVLSADEFYVPYTRVSSEPDYSDVPFRIRLLHYYRHQVKAMKGFWSQVDQLLNEEPPGWDMGIDQPLADSARDAQGLEVSDNPRSNAYTILWYEGWYDLPDPDDENKYKEYFIQAIVDYSSKHVLKLAVHMEPSMRELERYERDMRDMQAYRQVMQQRDEQVGARAAMRDRLASDDITDGERDAIELQLRIMEDFEPVPPMWLEDPEDIDALPPPPKLEPIHMFTHGVNIEPYGSSMGMGFGNQLANHNRASNTAVNQFIDASTLANSWCVLTTLRGLEGFEIAPGMIKYVKGSAQDLQQGVKELKPAPANPQLVDFANMARDWAMSSAQAPSVLSGEPGKSGETFKGLATRVEQAQKQLSVSTLKYATDVLTNVLRCNARLNSLYLPESQLIRLSSVFSPPSEPVRVDRSMYERDYFVEIRAELHFKPESEKIREADEVVDMSLNHPMLQANPRFQYRALVKALKARGQEDMIETLGPEPPPGPPPAPPAPPGAPPGPQAQPGPQAPPGPPGPPRR